MALTNSQRVRKAFDTLRDGLLPFIKREFKAKLGPYWEDDLLSRVRGIRGGEKGINWDPQAMLKAMIDSWRSVFDYTLGHVERAYVSELIDVRNKWAHEKPFTSEDVHRALDTMQRLLQAISAGEQAETIGVLKADLMRTVYAEEARNKTRYQLPLDGMPQAGLKPWREVITPHKDVASGRYMQAEFAADLAQVHRGEGSDEYRNPQEFYRRTYITGGLKDLLSGALRRVACKGDGEPVVELQTNFGGGKTHAMLALYHLFSGVKTSSLEGIEPVLKAADVKKAPKANRAVLVGTALSPAEVSIKGDGTEVHTLWGEMAWQLGGSKGYVMVAESDRKGTAPGSNDLSALFKEFGPCVILIDEWVAYARQLVGKNDLPAGAFEAQDSFAQALTEAVKRAPGTMVVASIPASKIEIGGQAGAEAVDVLKNVFKRVATPWRPATGDEGFEIVRRRLFEPIQPGNHSRRNAVVTAFARMYKSGKEDFPPECSEGSYIEELSASYPVHPELFRRLYDDWSTLDRFQRTRGVLRLLARVIHRLWETQDAGLLILPSSIPMDDAPIRDELTVYLPNQWEPIISQEVDGPKSLPLELDRANPNLGRVSACRRVARALYIGTAPGAETQNPGVGAERIRLACTQPGESTAVFGDALRRIMDKGRYVQQDVNRYWISTRANLNRTAHDRAMDYLKQPEEIHAEIIRRLEKDRKSGDFVGVHICPPDSADVPDEPSARLVVLRPDAAHKRNQDDSAARKAALAILDMRGNSPRINRNTLVFLAADDRELESLAQSVAQHLAWSSILRDKSSSLDLTASQINLAENKKTETDSTTNARINNTYVWSLVPCQDDPAGPISWEQHKVPTGGGVLAERTAVKVRNVERLYPSIGAVILRMKALNRLWQDRDHVTVGDLADWMPKYLYLPRIKNSQVINDAVLDASALVIDDTFATADAFDEDKKRFIGLRLGGTSCSVTNNTCLVSPDVAKKQAKDEQPPEKNFEPEPGDVVDPDLDYPEPDGGNTHPGPTKPTLFVGSVKLDADRVGRDAGRVHEEILANLTDLPGVKATVTLEIQVRVPGGIDEDVVRVVSENATVLKFDHAGFEKE